MKEGVTEVRALKVFQDSCHYLYLPRLVNDQTYKNAINNGISSEDYFAYAAGKDGDKYLGFAFGRDTMINIDDASLLIDREAADAYREAIKPAPQPVTPNPEPGLTPTASPESETVIPSPSPAPQPKPTPEQIKKQFYGNIDLDPVKAKMDFATIVDEVVQQFTSKLGVEVSISVEIQAKSKDGFDEALQRTIKENCNVLKFNSSEFEE